MLNLFRRHVTGCPNNGKRTGQRCPRKPPCPIHVEGIDGQGRKIKPQTLIDPRTGNGIRDWARACEVIRDMEAPAPVIVVEKRTPISKAIEHFRNTKLQTSIDRQRKTKNLLGKFQAFMAANPRNHQF
ncbi:MAG: hypothetical protein ACRD7E_09990, partial [Bryobacteraceae bacterium]